MYIMVPQAVGGKHRKAASSKNTKKSIAVVAMSVGSVSLAGVGGAAVATAQSHAVAFSARGAEEVDHELVSHTAPTSSAATDGAPQILAIAEYKPVPDIDEHLNTVIEYNNDHFAAFPGAKVVKPAEGTYTSGFEMRWGSFHAGVDIANAANTPIVAAMDGVVIDSGPASGFGQWIRLQHEDGTITVYGHMETLDVSVGEQVTAGQKIAGMGSLGFSTGDHLHFEVHPAGSAAIDPVPWLAEHGIAL